MVAVSVVLSMTGACLAGVATADAAGTGDAAAPSVIKVGVNPDAVAFDAVTHTVYVANGGGSRGDSVSVIDESGDARTGTVTATIGVGKDPSGVAVDPTNHNVYTVNSSPGSVSVIDESGDARTGTVTATIVVGHAPIGIAVDPTTHAVYVTMGNSDYVAVIDESGDARSGTVVARIPVGREASGVAVDTSNHKVYVTNTQDSTVSVIDGSGDADNDTVTATIPTSGEPFYVAVDSSNHNVYAVGSSFDGSTGGPVSVIDESGDARTGRVVGTTRFPGAAGGVAVDPTSHDVYVANETQGNDVVVIDESGDARTGRVLDTVAVAPYLNAIAVDPSVGHAYVVSAVDQTVTVLPSPLTLGPWSGPVATRHQPLSGSAAGFYLGETHNRWELYVTQPPGSAAATYSGSITTNEGSFARVIPLRLEATDSFTVDNTLASSHIDFSFVNYGAIDGIQFAPTDEASMLNMALSINGSPAPVNQIFLGASAAHPAAASFSLTRTP